MRIGFYGDSFCKTVDTDLGFDTYIKKTLNHYNAELVHLGVGGSSVWDVILLQFPREPENIPDVCVFTWTNPDRLFHREVREITDRFHKKNDDKPELKDAVTKYYQYLHDREKAVFEVLAAMYYFDMKILSQIKSKIVHLWSFGNDYKEPKITELGLEYEFTSGIDTKLDMSSLSTFGYKYPNHIYGEENNQLIFETIQRAIDL